MSNHLLMEYEEILKLNSVAIHLSLSEIDDLLDALSLEAEEWTLSKQWQPILTDPDDEPLVQLAYESKALTLVSHNIRDLRPAEKLGIVILTPKELLSKIRRKP